MARPRRHLENRFEKRQVFTQDHLSAARGLFSSAVRRRGQEYFESRRVIFDSLSAAGADFRVRGNAGRYYSVFLSGHRVELSSCDCPFPDYCKHIWAALLTAVDEGLALKAPSDGPVVPFPGSGPGSGAVTAAAADGERRLDSTGGITVPAPAGRRERSGFPTEDSWVSSMLRDPVLSRNPRLREPEKRYQLIFLMGVYGIHFRNPEIYVRPALRYIRLDKKPGAVSGFRESAVLDNPDPLEQMLLEACLRYDGKRLNIHTALGYFQGAGSIPVYTDAPGDPFLIRFIRPEKIEVDFEPEYLDSDITFQPRLMLKAAGEPDCQLYSDGSVVDLQGAEKILFNPVTGIFALVPLPDFREVRILDLLVNSSHRWHSGEIDELTGLMPEDFIHPGDISTDVRINEWKPGIILEIDEEKNFLALLFYLDDSEIPEIEDVRHNGNYWELNTIGYQAVMRDIRRIAGNLGGVMEDVNRYRVDISLNDFLEERVPGLLEMGLELRLGRSDIRIRRAGDFRIESVSGIDWLGLNVRVDEHEYWPEGFSPAGRLLRSGSDYILLDNEQLEKLRVLAQLPADATGRIRFHPDDIGAVQLLGNLADEFDDPRLERTREIIVRLERGFEFRERPVSSLLKAELRDYQKTGLEWLRFLKSFGLGGILADDMGLGKTVQTLALLADEVEAGKAAEVPGPFLIVAPLSTIPNWAAEFRRFLPSMDLKVHAGTGRGELGENPRGAVLTTYQILYRDEDAFAAVEWKLLCIDESQNIKNSRTKTFRAVRRLSAVQTLALSGTPIENSVMELWSVMELTNPGILGPRDRFKRRYLKASKEGDVRRMSELRKRVAPFILRRTKDVVAGDLPPKEEIVRTVTLSPPERRFYNRLKNDLREIVKRIIAQSVPGARGRRDFSVANAVLMALLRLRQAAISPALLGEKPESSSKIDEVLYLLDTLLSENHKVLIFSQFVKVLEILRKRLEEKEIGYAYLDGSLSLKARGREIREFKDEKSVFLISLKAGGTGLNLTEADYVFILDPWWNPAVESQAIDRTHRIGQDRPVIAYKFISTDTVEEHILELQESKRKIAEDILGFDSSIISRMDTEEILKLFG